jgi:hypothetical protein
MERRCTSTILVRKKGIGRHEAVEELSRLHGAKLSTVTRMLNDYRRKICKKYEQEAPENLPTIKQWLKGFTPPNR